MHTSKPGKKVIIYYTQSLKFNITNQAIFSFKKLFVHLNV